MEYIFRDINEAWVILFNELGDNENKPITGDFFQSKPRGRLCNEFIDLSFKIMQPEQCLVWSKIRGLSPIYLAKECLWYLNGSRDIADVPSSIWNDLINIEGPDKGLINSNYGHWLFVQKDNKNPQLTIWEATIDLLKRDKDSRQALIQIPIMPYRQYNDTPCTSSAHFILRENKLYLTVYMRSNDIWFGAPNDWTQFILWQMMMAKELNVELGWFRFTTGSCHVYEENFIKDIVVYTEQINSEFIKGKQNIHYWKLYDARDYRFILNELLSDFKILALHKKDDIMTNNLLRNEQLKYMLNNMEIKKFIH